MPAVAYHCHAKVISRTKGQSAVASAAYRTGQRLEDERYGKVQDFSRKAGVEFVWHAVPAGAPEWAKDVGQTWNEVERAEVRRNSTLAREYVAAFPSQLNAERREWMLKDWVREEFTRKGLIATAVIHAPDKNGDERNFHAHVMVAERPVDADGWMKHKDRSLISRETLVEIKEKWAELGARQLERAGYEVEAERWRHGHKTLKQQEAAALERGDMAYVEQVREREATTHVGPVASAIERKGRVSERGELNREIEARNTERKEIEVDLAAVREQLERLVAEPIAERVEVDSLPVLAEPRRSTERHLEKAEVEGSAPEKAEGSEKAERLREERELAAAAIKEAWKAAERDPVEFAIGLGERGLTLAENEKGRFVAVDERGGLHSLSGGALGEKPWEVQRDLATAFLAGSELALPGVAEVREELREARDAERAESALGWAAHRRAEAAARAALWEERKEAWKEQRELDRLIERVGAAQERPQSAVVAAIGRAYAESSNGADFVSELEQRGLMVCRVSAEEAERSRTQREVLGTTPSYQEGDVVAMTEHGHAYRINAETIAMTATNTYDHVQNVAERLADIEPGAVMSLSQAQEVVTEQANERGSIAEPVIEGWPSAWEMGRGAEAAVDAAEGVASMGAEMVLGAGEALAMWLEEALGGARRKAPGGAEYEPRPAAGPPPPVVERRDAGKEKQERLRTTSGVEATQNPAAKAKVEEKQGQSFAEQYEQLRRDKEKAARERAELYRERDDEDRDRER